MRDRGAEGGGDRGVVGGTRGLRRDVRGRGAEGGGRGGVAGKCNECFKMLTFYRKDMLCLEQETAQEKLLTL